MPKLFRVSLFVPTLIAAIASFALCASNGKSIEAQLREVANETRKSLPMMMNDELQATSIGAVGKFLINKYNFRLLVTANG